MGSTACVSCGCDFGRPLLAGENANLDPQLLQKYRWTTVAMGHDPLTRRVGNALATGCVIFALYVVQLLAFSDTGQHPMLLLLIAGSSLLTAKFIHDFAYGRPLYLFRMGHYDASPANAGLRTLGLIANLLLQAFFMWVVWR